MCKTLLFSLIVPVWIWAQPSSDLTLDLEHKSIGNSKLKRSDASFKSNANRIAIYNGMFGVSYEQYDLSWHNKANIPIDLTSNGANPLTHIKSFRLGTKYPKMLSKNKAIIMGASIGTTYEKEMANSFGATIFAVMALKHKNNFSTSYGAIINYHPVRTLTLPAIGLGYRQKESLGLRCSLGFPKTSIVYGLNEHWQIIAGVVFESVIAKLSSNSPISPSGYMEINAYQSDLTLRYDQTKRLFFEGSYRYTPIYQFTTYNSNGNKIKKYELETTNGFAFRVGYRL